MSLFLHHLDQRTRDLMLEEIEDAEQKGKLLISDQFNVHGKINYSTLFKTAVRNGNAETLAKALVLRHSFKDFELDHYAFANQLAETEFNRYYIRAICKRAIQDGISTVFLYDAHEKAEEISSTALDAASLLRDLKEGASLLSQTKPNHGLSVKIDYHPY